MLNRSKTQTFFGNKYAQTVSRGILYGGMSYLTFNFLNDEIDTDNKALFAIITTFTSLGLNASSHLLREFTYRSKELAHNVIELKQRLPFTRIARTIILASFFLQMRVFSYISAQSIDFDAVPMSKNEFIGWVTGMFALAFAVDELPHIVKVITKKCFNKELPLPALLDLVWKTGQFGLLAGATLYAWMHRTKEDDPLSFEGEPTAGNHALWGVIGAAVIALPSVVFEECVYRLCIKSRIVTPGTEKEPLLKGEVESEPEMVVTSATDSEPRHWLAWLEHTRIEGFFVMAKIIEFLPKTTQFLFVSNLAICLSVLYANIVAHEHTDIDGFAHYVQTLASVFGIVLGAWAHQHIYSLVFKMTEVDEGEKNNLDSSFVILEEEKNEQELQVEEMNVARKTEESQRTTTTELTRKLSNDSEEGLTKKLERTESTLTEVSLVTNFSVPSTQDQEPRERTMQLKREVNEIILSEENEEDTLSLPECQQQLN